MQSHQILNPMMHLVKMKKYLSIFTFIHIYVVETLHGIVPKVN